MEKQNKFLINFIDLSSGILGGSSGIFVGQPFDTIKVRLQTHSSYYSSAMDCVRQTLKNEGVRGFFKGLSSPMFGSIPNSALVFGSYGASIRYISGNDDNPKLSDVFLAGTLAGFVQCLAVCPTELIKCRLQVQDGHSGTKYNGPIDCAKQMFKARGIRGMYLGWWPTVVRESPSFGLYFYLYEAAKRWLNGDAEETSYFNMMLAGGYAGVVSWGFCYPADVIKSSVQTLPEIASVEERSMVYQIRKVVRQQGYRAFTNGLGTTLIRAFPVNAVTLSIYDLATNTMSDKFLH